MSVKIVGILHGDTFHTEKGYVGKGVIQVGGLNDAQARLSPKGVEQAEELSEVLSI
ncbi:MAG: hypothetical protein HYX67_06370 [Candidatus Melainabacteria bacterium]|nr:hypothetical protein [Candidatus Melainabacteria bacterium]